jgi:hypothetical protein
MSRHETFADEGEQATAALARSPGLDSLGLVIGIGAIVGA